MSLGRPAAPHGQGGAAEAREIGEAAGEPVGGAPAAGGFTDALLLLDPLLLLVLALLDTLQATAYPFYAALAGTAHWDGEAVSATLAVAAVATLLLVATTLTLWPRHYLRVKSVALPILVLLLVVAPIANRAYLRFATGRHLEYAHDGGVVQTEESARFLLRGIDPYRADFSSTPLAGVDIPAILHHNPYLPGSFVLPAPLIALADSLRVPFDQRAVYLALYGAGVWLIPRAFRRRSIGELARTIFALNPLIVTFMEIGRNDIYVIAFLLFAIVALERRRPYAFFLCLALACATKQLAWFVAPFLLLCVRQVEPRRPWRRAAVLGAALFAALVLPFYLWDPGAFVDSVYKFNAGLLPDSYPLGGTPGFGFAMLAAVFHWVPDRRAYFELTPYLLVTALPLAVLLLWRLARRPSTSQALLGAFVVSFWIYFFSRVFHNNYLGLLTFLLQMGLFAAIDGAPG
jgi:hypothetical protein